ncbi:hypothetical protein HELRODRAFT_183613 [Helobdella robusta]|uniref:Uncharacterized protein n=1 Tax=Helobdella robusta TaxID=6412 RepID=T1FJX7_HELRO|nr:hypothetical protein HELRODRAFT_183613 [Helobdella robusta]ESO10456.1 hypothetical protein HELRODRAFT_183613 [Helobdella robusta]
MVFECDIWSSDVPEDEIVLFYSILNAYIKWCHSNPQQLINKGLFPSGLEKIWFCIICHLGYLFLVCLLLSRLQFRTIFTKQFQESDTDVEKNVEMGEVIRKKIQQQGPCSMCGRNKDKKSRTLRKNCASFVCADHLVTLYKHCKE